MHSYVTYHVHWHCSDILFTSGQWMDQAMKESMAVVATMYGLAPRRHQILLSF